MRKVAQAPATGSRVSIKCITLCIASNAMTLHTICAVILAQKFCKHDFFRWIPFTGSTLLSSALRQKLFQSAHLRDASSQAHLTINHKKCHSHVHRPPVTILHSTTNCAIGSQSFLLQVSFLANFEGRMLLSKTAMDKMHTMDSLLWATNTEERKKKGSQNVHPTPKMHAKIKKKKKTDIRSRCSPDCEQEGKDTFFFEFGGRFLDRWCSSSLVFFPYAIYSCQRDLAKCFTCLHQSKASQKSPRGVANLGLQTCMQPDV